MKDEQNMGHALEDDALEAVSGGATVVQQLQRFQLDDMVKVSHSNGRYNFGRVTDCDYDEELGQWTYQVEFGYYHGSMWVGQGPASDKYYPQSQLSQNDITGSGYYWNT